MQEDLLCGYYTSPCNGNLTVAQIRKDINVEAQFSLRPSTTLLEKSRKVLMGGSARPL